MIMCNNIKNVKTVSFQIDGYFYKGLLFNVTKIVSKMQRRCNNHNMVMCQPQPTGSCGCQLKIYILTIIGSE